LFLPNRTGEGGEKMFIKGTNIWCAYQVLLEEKRSVHYEDLCGILKKKFPDFFPASYTPKHLNASLSKELKNADTLFIRDGNGYYSVRIAEPPEELIELAKAMNINPNADEWIYRGSYWDEPDANKMCLGRIGNRGYHPVQLFNYKSKNTSKKYQIGQCKTCGNVVWCEIEDKL
jgi:hypothetical protein